jgi:hypothetical protein
MAAMFQLLEVHTVDCSVLADLSGNSEVDFHWSWATELDSVDYCYSWN